MRWQENPATARVDDVRVCVEQTIYHLATVDDTSSHHDGGMPHMLRPILLRHEARIPSMWYVHRNLPLDARIKNSPRLSLPIPPGHVCCAECLDTWLGNSEEYTCPICRYNPETDQDDDVLDLSGCRPVYLKFGEGSSSASSSPVRRPARPSTASLPGLMRKMDGARHRINGLVIQDAFPVAAELRPAVHGIQGLVDEVRRDLQSAEVQVRA